MAAKLKITSRSTGAIRHVGPGPASGPEAIAKALGAELMSRENTHGAPISLHALRQELQSRVRSTGGRPALEGATKIQKIPLKPEDWSRLEALADGAFAARRPRRQPARSQASWSTLNYN